MNKYSLLPKQHKKLLLKETINESIGKMRTVDNLKIQIKQDQNAKPTKKDQELMPGIKRVYHYGSLKKDKSFTLEKKIDRTRQKSEKIGKKNSTDRNQLFLELKKQLLHSLEQFFSLFDMKLKVQMTKDKILLLLQNIQKQKPEFFGEQLRINAKPLKQHAHRTLSIHSVLHLSCLPNKHFIPISKNQQKLNQQLQKKHDILDQLQGQAIVAQLHLANLQKQAQSYTQIHKKIQEMQFKLNHYALAVQNVFNAGDQALKNLMQASKIYHSHKQNLKQSTKNSIFTSVYYQIQSSKFIKDEIQQELNQILQNLHIKSQDWQINAVISSFAKLVNRALYIYECVMNQIINANKEQQAFIKKIIEAHGEYFSADHCKHKLLESMKNKYVELNAQMHSIFNHYEQNITQTFTPFHRDPKADVQSISIKSINENDSMHKNKSYSIKKIEDNVFRVKNVQFRPNQSSKQLNKTALKPMIIDHTSKAIYVKWSDFQILRKCIQMAENIFLGATIFE